MRLAVGVEPLTSRSPRPARQPAEVVEVEAVRVLVGGPHPGHPFLQYGISKMIKEGLVCSGIRDLVRQAQRVTNMGLQAKSRDTVLLCPETRCTPPKSLFIYGMLRFYDKAAERRKL